jgi:hypothetical protein
LLSLGVVSDALRPNLFDQAHPQLITDRLGKDRGFSGFVAWNSVINRDVLDLAVNKHSKHIEPDGLVMKHEHIFDPFWFLCEG